MIEGYGVIFSVITIMKRDRLTPLTVHFDSGLMRWAVQGV